MSVLPSAPARTAMSFGAPRSISLRRSADRAFLLFCLAVTSVSTLILFVLLAAIVWNGWDRLSWEFLTNYASRFPDKAGFKAAMWGSVWVCVVCALTAVPLGVGTAVFLEEYGPKQGFARRIHSLVQLNISNLAGVPSVVYGIIGLTAFARMFGVFGPASLSNYDEMIHLRLHDGTVLIGQSLGEDDTAITIDDLRTGEHTARIADIASRDEVYTRQHLITLKDGTLVEGRLSSSTPKVVRVFAGPGSIVDVPRDQIAAYDSRNMLQFGSRDSYFHFHLPLGGGVLAAGLTLMLVVLPIVIVSTREALRAVPPSLREGASALGATRWQVVSKLVIPNAVPGIMTGAILSMSRAIGEAAPILVVSGIVFIMSTPSSLMSDFSAMPLQIFSWANMPQAEFKSVAAAGIVVLLAVLMVFNITAVIIRQKLQKALQS